MNKTNATRIKTLICSLAAFLIIILSFSCNLDNKSIQSDLPNSSDEAISRGPGGQPWLPTDQHIRTGLRHSSYGYNPSWPDETWYKDTLTDITNKFNNFWPNSYLFHPDATAMLIVAETDCDDWDGIENFGDVLLYFDRSGGPVDSNTVKIYSTSDIDDLDDKDYFQPYLDYVQALGGKIWLQISPGHADVDTLLDMVWDQYSSYSDIIAGFGIDLEWHKKDEILGDPNYEGTPLTISEIKTYVDQIKVYNSDFKLFLKHWQATALPQIDDWTGNKNYVNEIVFINDWQGTANLTDFVTKLKAYWFDYLAAIAGTDVTQAANAGIQFGYENDRAWWETYNDPMAVIGKRLINEFHDPVGWGDADSGLTGINVTDLIWVDFTAQSVWNSGYVGPPLWDEPVWYTGDYYGDSGDEIYFQGNRWKCKFSHTSQAGWYPGAPGLWFWEQQ